jgi:large subunit ribosomal protein L35
MPKMKTHRGVAARVKITGSGRLRRRQQMRGHLFEKKNSVRTRRLARDVDFAKGDEKRMKRLIGM